MWDGKGSSGSLRQLVQQFLSETGGLLVPALGLTPSPQNKMGARKGHKHEMRVRVSECGGDLAPGRNGQTLSKPSGRCSYPGRHAPPGHCPTFHSRGGVGVLGEVMEDSIPCLFSESEPRPRQGREGRDLVRSPELFLRGVPSK